MATIDVNGTTLHYERSGDGPAMLFIHGMCGHADVWADQAARFADRFTCVRYDRRGHSRSSWGDAPMSDALHADDAAALIEALGLAPCLVVGSSGGARITVDVALRHGHLLRGAVVSEPPLFCLDRDAASAMTGELIPLVEEARAAGGPGGWVDAFFSYVCPGLWSTIDEAHKDRYRANGEVGLTDLQSPALDVTPADLSAVTVPTLVIAGADSHPTFGSIARRLAAALPDSRFVEIERSGHVTYAERPDDFAAAVSAFATELGRRSALSAT